MIRVKVPFVTGMLRPETLAWSIENDAELCELANSDESYYWNLRTWWLDPEPGDLCIVEQDILPPAGAIAEMRACTDSHWCACQYDLHPTLEDGRKDLTQTIPFGWGLGCTRFSYQLRRDHPELADRAGERLVFGPEPDPDPVRCWWVMDMRLTMSINRLGHLPHDHGKASHLL